MSIQVIMAVSETLCVKCFLHSAWRGRDAQPVTDTNSSASLSPGKAKNILILCPWRGRYTINAESFWFFLMQASFILLDRLSTIPLKLVFHCLEFLPATNSLNVKQWKWIPWK